MKTCLICGALVTDEPKTCPKCGEGSWSRSVEAMLEDASVKPVGSKPAAESAPLETPKAPAPTPATQDKRDPKAKR